MNLKRRQTKVKLNVRHTNAKGKYNIPIWNIMTHCCLNAAVFILSKGQCWWLWFY